MPLNFPNSPSTNDVHSEGGRSWTWNGTTWTLNVYTGVIPPGSVGTTELAANAVATTDIADLAVTTDKLANASVTVAKLPSGATNGKALLANSATASGLEWGQAGSPADDGSAIIGSQIFS